MQEYTVPELRVEVVSPSYLAVNHSGMVLYAVSEPVDDSHGLITAFAI